MTEWQAEQVVDEQAARRLIGGQFPEVELGRLELLGEGWDNTVWLVDGRWVFRFPRRHVVLPGQARELQVLPQIAARLPLRIPEPVFVGEPADGYPWRFSGCPLIPGREPGQVELDDAARIAQAGRLAEFLRELHAIDPGSLEGPPLPVDAVRRADMAHRAAMSESRFREARDLGVWAAPAAAGELLQQALGLPPAQHTALAHGDLHLRHVLLGDGLELTGVIDWIDVCRADPAIDLVLYWSFLPPAGRGAFRDAYGPIRPDQLVRSRVLAFFLSATLAVYGRREGVVWLEREALRGLEFTAAG